MNEFKDRVLLPVSACLLILASASSQAAPDCSRLAGSLPDPERAQGSKDTKIPVEHFVVLMQENHSFDQYFGHLPQSGHRGPIDVMPEDTFNLDSSGKPVKSFHQRDLCTADVDHGWNGSHFAWNGGLNDRFVQVNESSSADGSRVMGYYDESDIPFYYGLAKNFAIGDRYFASVLGPTYPNRYYLFAATSFGHITNILPKPGQYDQPTIFDLMSENNVSWKYYFSDAPATALFTKMFARNLKHMAPLAQFKIDAALGRLPSVAFVETYLIAGMEHPPFNPQFGQLQAQGIVRSLMRSKSWARSALMFTYDEGGGYYDHVAPPDACEPDDIAPLLGKGDVQQRFSRLGFRVPFVMVSPYAKRGYVSHQVYDHTSVLKLIETKFNLPALTARDANAGNLLDMLDFEHPDFSQPNLPMAEIDWERAKACASKLLPRPKP